VSMGQLTIYLILNGDTKNTNSYSKLSGESRNLLGAGVVVDGRELKQNS